MFWKKAPDLAEEEKTLPGDDKETTFVDIQAKYDTPRGAPDFRKSEASTQF